MSEGAGTSSATESGFIKNRIIFNEWYVNPVSILLMYFDGLIYIIQG
jgi:hypothetical protein